MSFIHPYVLLLALLPLAWIAWSWNDSGRRAALVLKGFSLCAILLALVEPVVTLPQTKTGAIVLVDTSGSITGGDLERASTFVSQMERSRHGNWMKVVPFASETRELSSEETSSGVRLRATAHESGQGTNLEAALMSSMSAIPYGYIPRLVLLSDGNENQGSVVRAVAELQRLHVPVDTVPLSGRSVSGLKLQSISIPRDAFAGEQIPIDLAVESPGRLNASVAISADGKSLGSNDIDLKMGSNLVRVHARVNTSGATSIAGRITAPNVDALPFEQAIRLRRAKILYFSDDPPGTEANLLQVFQQADFELTRNGSALEKGLDAYQLIILNNLDLNTFTASQKENIERYVKNGGGLLLIGGERQVYKEDAKLDALDAVLPAKLAPPKTPQGTCVALIIDKSSSMEGRKIELARLSAIGVVDHLRPVDTIGILIFDNSFQWAVPMRRAEDKSLIRRLVSGITPDGGTQIAPALAEAYRRVQPSKATYKHIVLLTDGISEEGDSLELAKEALSHHVTISTVGLGQDVNRAYLEKVALTSGGRSYFLNDPQGLEQILLKDVQDYSGSTAVEKPLLPIVEHKAEVLEGVGIDTAPALKGYTRFIAKPASDTVLQIDEAKKDPLYVRWQYGLGRAAVFSSDAKSRWAEAWVNWPGFDKFWINVSRDLLTHSDPSEASARFDGANDDILVTYRLGAGLPEPPAVPPIFVLGPEGFREPIEVRKSAPGVYSGRLHIGRLRGLFRIRPVAESSAFPEIGLFQQQEELQDYGSNEALLSQVSALTGGRYNTDASSVFHPDGRWIPAVWQLWPALLGLAIALSIAELITRKWSGLKGRFARRS